MKISIIVPVLNESGVIDTFAGNFELFDKRLEIIIVDGGSTDDTIKKANYYGFKVVRGVKTGRAFQMNEGASFAEGEIFFFLHCDSILPCGWFEKIKDAFNDWNVKGCCFDIRFDSLKPGMGLIAKAANLRSRITGIPYGDHGLAIRKDDFWKLGGFPEVPFLEDIKFSQTVKKYGRILFIDSAITTSARRWEEKGIIRTTLINWLVMILYFAGFRAEKLKRLYG